MKIVIYMTHRKESPLLTDIYHRLAQSDEHQVVLVTDTDQGIPIEAVSMSRFGGEVPDLVLQGAGASNGLLVSWDYVKDQGIKTVHTVISDTDWIQNSEKWNNYRHFVFFDGIIMPWSIYSPASKRCADHIEITETLRNAEKFYIPFYIDPEKYIDMNRDRDRFVCHICSVDQAKTCHYMRMQQRMWLAQHQEYAPIVGNAFGADYLDILNRSWISMVDDTNRGYMTQKYLESVCCGAVVAGPRPAGFEKYWVDDHTFLELDYHDIGKSMEKRLKYYQKNLNSLKKIRKRAKEMVVENFHIDQGVEAYLDMFERLQ